MNLLTEQYIVDILVHEMDLNTQNVWISNQNKDIAIDQGLYIAVGLVASQTISNVSTAVPTDAGMNEIQQVLTRQTIQIDILSKSNDALYRREEVIAALGSIYSNQVQEGNYFRIFPVNTSFVNTSSAEGGSQINRFSIQFACHAWFRKEKIVTDYYTSFETIVQDDVSINILPIGRITADGFIRITAEDNIRIIAERNAIAEFTIN